MAARHHGNNRLIVILCLRLSLINHQRETALSVPHGWARHAPDTEKVGQVTLSKLAACHFVTMVTRCGRLIFTVSYRQDEVGINLQLTVCESAIVVSSVFDYIPNLYLRNSIRQLGCGLLHITGQLEKQTHQKWSHDIISTSWGPWHCAGTVT